MADVEDEGRLTGASWTLLVLYGLIFWFQSQSWAIYLGFAVPSFVLMLVHAPVFVLTRRVTYYRGLE